MAQPKPNTPVLPSLETFLASERLLPASRSVELLRFMSEQELTAGSAVMRLEWVKPQVLSEKLAQTFNIPTVGPGSITGERMRKVLSEDKIRSWQVIPIDFVEDTTGRKLLLGMTDPLHRAIQQSAETLTHLPIIPAFLAWTDFLKICEEWFQG